MYKILIVEEGKRLESMSMKLLELIVLKKGLVNQQKIVYIIRANERCGCSSMVELQPSKLTT